MTDVKAGGSTVFNLAGANIVPEKVCFRINIALFLFELYACRNVFKNTEFYMTIFVLSKFKNRIEHTLFTLSENCNVLFSLFFNLHSVSKNVPLCNFSYLRPVLTNCHNSLTGIYSRQLAIKCLLNISPRFNCVATLPCETKIFKND